MKAKAHPGKEMMPTTSRLGGVLRRHRERLGLNLQTVASRAGITPVALHNLATGKSSAKSDTFERVANAMGLDYDIVTHEAAAEARHEEEEARQERAVFWWDPGPEQPGLRTPPPAGRLGHALFSGQSAGAELFGR